MTFLAPGLLIGLAGLTLPVIIHLLYRRTAKVVDWGAMRFLLDSVVHRHRWMQIQELILMFLRILVPVAAALAMARPFLPPAAGSTSLAVGGLLVGAAFLGAMFTTVKGRLRWLCALLATLAVAAAFLLFAIERKKMFGFLGGMGEGDWAIVIDASPSMGLLNKGETLLDKAIQEARQVIEKAPRAASFTIIRGAPVPEAMVMTPTKDREVLTKALSAIKPAPAEMDAIKAISLAALALADGQNQTKGILVLSDTQRAGWNMDKSEDWSGVKDLLEKLPGGAVNKPIMRMVSYASSGYERNLSVNNPRLSRERVGTDRSAQVLVDLKNHGRESATARRVTFLVDGKPVGEVQPPTLSPGESVPVKFTHKFGTNGFAHVSVKLDADDDMAFDNTTDLVVPVVPPLRTLLVESRSSRRRTERATFFLEFALKPFAKGEASPVDADVVAADDVEASTTLESYDVIVLSDVPRLPEAAAKRISAYVHNGGGLLIAPGPKADTDFYNGLLKSFSPTNSVVKLDTWKEAKKEDPMHLAARTPGISGKQEPLSNLDWSEISVFGAWSVTQTGKLTSGGATLMKFDKGDPFLTCLFSGRGRVGLMALPLDTAFSNIPSHPVFIPIAHGLMDYLAGGVAVPVNLSTDWSHDNTWRNPAFSHNPLLGEGMVGLYESPIKGAATKSFTRLDPNVFFDWQLSSAGSNRPGVRAADNPDFPKDDFKVRWTGILRVPREDTYSFYLQADDKATLTVDGSAAISQEGQRSMKLSPAKPVKLELQFEDASGPALCKLNWHTSADGAWKPIPPSVLTPDYPDEKPLELKVVDEKGGEYKAQWVPGMQNCRMMISSAMQPGFYSAPLPKRATDFLVGWLTEKSPLRFTVQRSSEESAWTTLTEPDLDTLKGTLGLTVTDSAIRSFTGLEGQSKGRELWRILLYLLVGVAITETLFAGLIAWSRKPTVSSIAMPGRKPSS